MRLEDCFTTAARLEVSFSGVTARSQLSSLRGWGPRLVAHCRCGGCFPWRLVALSGQRNSSAPQEVVSSSWGCILSLMDHTVPVPNVTVAVHRANAAPPKCVGVSAARFPTRLYEWTWKPECPLTVMCHDIF